MLFEKIKSIETDIGIESILERIVWKCKKIENLKKEPSIEAVL